MQIRNSHGCFHGSSRNRPLLKRQQASTRRSSVEPERGLSCVARLLQ